MYKIYKDINIHKKVLKLGLRSGDTIHLKVGMTLVNSWLNELLGSIEIKSNKDITISIIKENSKYALNLKNAGELECYYDNNRKKENWDIHRIESPQIIHELHFYFNYHFLQLFNTDPTYFQQKGMNVATEIYNFCNYVSNDFLSNFKKKSSKIFTKKIVNNYKINATPVSGTYYPYLKAKNDTPAFNYTGCLGDYFDLMTQDFNNAWSNHELTLYLDGYTESELKKINHYKGKILAEEHVLIELNDGTIEHLTTSKNFSSSIACNPTDPSGKHALIGTILRKSMLKDNNKIKSVSTFLKCHSDIFGGDFSFGICDNGSNSTVGSLPSLNYGITVSGHHQVIWEEREHPHQGGHYMRPKVQYGWFYITNNLPMTLHANWEENKIGFNKDHSEDIAPGATLKCQTQDTPDLDVDFFVKDQPNGRNLHFKGVLSGGKVGTAMSTTYRTEANFYSTDSHVFGLIQSKAFNKNTKKLTFTYKNTCSFMGSFQVGLYNVFGKRIRELVNTNLQSGGSVYVDITISDWSIENNLIQVRAGNAYGYIPIYEGE